MEHELYLLVHELNIKIEVLTAERKRLKILNPSYPTRGINTSIGSMTRKKNKIKDNIIRLYVEPRYIK